MSGTFNPLAGGNGATPSAPAQGTTPSPQPFNHAAMHQAIVDSSRGLSEDDMIRHRDVGGRELGQFAAFANDPDLNRRDIEGYLAKLTGMGDITNEEALGILKTLPQGDKADLQSWARMMFQAVMLRTIHAHAAFPVQFYPPTDRAQPQTQEEQGEPQQDDEEGQQ